LKPESFEYWSPDRSVRIVTGIFLEGEDPRGDHGVGKLVELNLRPLLALHPPLSPLTPSGKCNYASCSSQTQKAVSLFPCSRGMTTT